MSNKENAQEIFDLGQDEDKSRDTIIVEMVQAGVSLNSAQNWYADMAKAAGLTNPRIGHKTEALEYLDEVQPDVVDNEVRATTRIELSDKFGVASSTANDYVKAWAAKEGIELPTSSFGANPEDQAKIYGWICENPNADKASFKEFMEIEMGRSSGSIDETWRGVVLARKLQADGIEFAEAA